MKEYNVFKLIQPFFKQLVNFDLSKYRYEPVRHTKFEVQFKLPVDYKETDDTKLQINDIEKDNNRPVYTWFREWLENNKKY